MNTFGSRSNLRVGDKEYEIYRIDALDKQGISTAKLPYSMRILLENLLRFEDEVVAFLVAARAAEKRLIQRIRLEDAVEVRDRGFEFRRALHGRKS